MAQKGHRIHRITYPIEFSDFQTSQVLCFVRPFLNLPGVFALLHICSTVLLVAVATLVTRVPVRALCSLACF